MNRGDDLQQGSSPRLPRVILTALGSRGDVNPLLALAARLQQRGAETRVLLAGGYESVAAAMGIRAEPVIEAARFKALLEHPDLWHPYRGPRLLLRDVVMGHWNALWSRLEQHVNGAGARGPAETVVISHPLDMAGRVLRDLHPQLTQLSVQLAPLMIRSGEDPPRLGSGVLGMRRPGWWFLLQCALADRLLIRGWLERPLNAHRAAIDLPEVRHPLASWCFSPDGVLCLYPQWYGPPPRDRRFFHAGFPLFDGPEAGRSEARADALTAPLANATGERRPLVFTAGTAHRQARTFFASAVHACQQLDLPGLLLTGQRSLLPRALPPRVRHVEYVPLGQLLPGCRAIVHHAGIGTTSQALASGTPQVVCPMAFDQFDNAMRVRRAGCGIELPMRRVTPRRLTAALRSVLQQADQGSLRCSGVADRLEEGTLAIDRAADWVLRQYRVKSERNSCFAHPAR